MSRRLWPRRARRARTRTAVERLRSGRHWEAFTWDQQGRLSALIEAALRYDLRLHEVTEVADHAARLNGERRRIRQAAEALREDFAPAFLRVAGPEGEPHEAWRMLQGEPVAVGPDRALYTRVEPMIEALRQRWAANTEEIKQVCVEADSLTRMISTEGNLSSSNRDLVESRTAALLAEAARHRAAMPDAEQVSRRRSDAAVRAEVIREIAADTEPLSWLNPPGERG